jgi:methionine synthase II (cobalamin-independent)
MAGVFLLSYFFLFPGSCASMPAPASYTRNKPPFRAEHVGSLLRPQALRAKRKEMEEKQRVPSDLKAIEDEAIKHAIKLQREIGIKTITDGEFRRSYS